MSAVRTGTAGWSIPALHASTFPGEGSHLQRYARVFGAAEINSSFYRPHRRATYERWACNVPEEFRFTVKLPREITHRRRLVGAEAALSSFFDQAAGLGDRLGAVLLQLPPSLVFEVGEAAAFFRDLRRLYSGEAACEPRHPSWAAPEAEGLLAAHRVARVAADPPPVPPFHDPGGFTGLAYFRLHGSPDIYRSGYSAPFLRAVADALLALPPDIPAYCIFDNTARGAAIPDARSLLELLGEGRRR